MVRRPPPQDPKGYNTLAREHSFRHPTRDGSTLEAFQELVAPQIEAFNSLSEDNEGDGTGLLNLGLRYIPEKVVFDQIGAEGADLGKGLGNRLSCTPSKQRRGHQAS